MMCRRPHHANESCFCFTSGFDVILRMGWFSMFHAFVDYFHKEVVFRPSVRRSLRFVEIEVPVNNDMSPYEVLYRMKCRPPRYCNEVEHKS